MPTLALTFSLSAACFASGRGRGRLGLAQVCLGMISISSAVRRAQKLEHGLVEDFVGKTEPARQIHRSGGASAGPWPSDASSHATSHMGEGLRRMGKGGMRRSKLGLRKGRGRGKGKGKGMSRSNALGSSPSHGPLQRKGSIEDCNATWTDSMGFDCLLYEGANWCTQSQGLGFGWCKSTHLNKKDKNAKFKSCILYDYEDEDYYYDEDYAETDEKDRWFGWGKDLHAFESRGQQLGPGDECAACGATCRPAPHIRKPNFVHPKCMDYAAPDGSLFREKWGYTCAAYTNGNFCAQDKLGKWTEGGLWNKEEAGSVRDYAWWTAKSGKSTMMHAFEACCGCGGGTTCLNGWKLPSHGNCVREFFYKDLAYSPCSLFDDSGKAWCAHDKEYNKDRWSYCEPCKGS